MKKVFALALVVGVVLIAEEQTPTPVPEKELKHFFIESSSEEGRL